VVVAVDLLAQAGDALGGSRWCSRRHGRRC
jgi:hypothetical protein